MQVPQLLIAVFCTVLTVAKGQDYRLPETIWPSKYEVDLLIPDTVFTGESDIFEGNVTIHFTVSNATTEIKLHHKVNVIDYELSSEIVDLGNDIANVNYDEVTEIFTIVLNTALSTDVDYQLIIQYNATFETTEMTGFYTSNYKDEDGNEEWLVTTQLQPSSARHAFPCWDEPQFKATFAVSLTYPTGLLALSNSNAENDTEIDDTYTKTVFKETTTMSTYLNAFIISNFTCTEGYTIATGVPHRICSRREEEPNRAFAAESGTTLIRTLESITGIKYGEFMPKMDQVAIPDFSAGAMENWGLVTYRERGLLYGEEDTNGIYKKATALVIAHEFTHMWFGNLLTCKLWDYTFLNEGFARFYQYFATAATQQFVDWELNKHFNVEQVHTALLADSTTSAQSLTSTAETPTEISNKFGTISYNKGASIYRMIETNIMGAENFVYGIRDYLASNQLSATVPSDLWDSLADYVPSNALPVNTTLEEVLYNWVELNGHPVVKVTSDGDNVILTQERFLLSGNDSREYYVPITYTTSADTTKFSNTTVKVWLTPDDESLTLEGVLSDDAWFIVNNRQAGFYRVDYDETILNRIIAQLHNNHLEIDVLNRAQLISDVYNFARSGRNGGYGTWTYVEALEVLSYLQHEVDYYPWYAALVGNTHLLQRIGLDSTEGQLFSTWMLGLMEEVYKTVPFDTVDSYNEVYSLKQSMILEAVCQYGEETCISKAQELFASYRDGGAKVPKDLRRTVYCTALRYSEDVETDFNFLWQKYTETSLSNDILVIFLGLGCAQDMDILKWYLNQTIDSTSGIRYQDISSVWSYVYTSSKNGTNAALEFIAENYLALNETYSSVGSLISSIAGYIYDTDQLEKLEALLNLSEISDDHKSTVESAIESANSTITWAATLKQDVAAYLDNSDNEDEDSDDDDSDESSASITKSSIFVVMGIMLWCKFVK